MSLLPDSRCWWTPGFPQNDRDAKRIFAAAQAAGLKKIDILWITHFHLDHVGGVPALAKMIPIDKFYDHGDSIEAGTPQGAKLYDDYKAVAQGKRALVKPGDKIPLAGVEITAVSAAGQVIGKADKWRRPQRFLQRRAAEARGQNRKQPERRISADLRQIQIPRSGRPHLGSRDDAGMPGRTSSAR